MICRLAVLLLLCAAPVRAGPPAAIPSRVNRLLSGMTLEQKVGQLMMVGFGGSEMGKEIAQLLLDHHIGSAALYRRNIRNNKQLSELIRDIRITMRNEIQPFIAIDQEGGNVVRVRTDVTVLPGAMVLGATRDPVLAFLVGQANAVDLRLLGIDMNMAPVLDINHNPRNPVINIRAFGDHPRLVAKMGAWLIQGQQQAGMATVAKHFPGHGTTNRDSHFALPRIDVPVEKLREIDLFPFREAFAGGLDAVMTAHVLVPSVEPGRIPASLSRRVITGLLREEMGFDGMVITDDLEMRAITRHWEIGEAAVLAIQAGADMVMVIWTPQKKHRVYESLLDAVRTGRITEARVDESVRRVLTLKARRGTLDALKGRPVKFSDVLPNPLHNRLVRTIAHRGMTLVRNKGGALPICEGRGVLVATPLSEFGNELKRLLPDVEVKHLRKVSSRKHRERELTALAELAARHRLTIVVVVNAYQAWLVQKLRHRTRRPLVAISFASPYYLRNFPTVDGYLCAYSYLISAQRAAARAVAGRTSITGRLPVTLNKNYQRGHGLFLPSQSCTAAASR